MANTALFQALGLLLIIHCLSHVKAFPDGPPLSACKDLRPGTQMGSLGVEGHTAVSQNKVPTYGRTREPPFHMQIHQVGTPTYQPDQEIAVSVIANQTTGHNIYRGILLQAREVICADNDTLRVYEHTVGTFKFIPDIPSLLKFMDCGGISNSAVSHKSPQWKMNETITWKAPDSSKGNIAFYATIVQEATVYWTDVHSVVVRDLSTSAPPVCGATSIYLSICILVASLMRMVL